jgi:very-short-patch-repair endonuclease
MNVTEREIGRIAGEQDNVITLEQLRGVGVARGALHGRLRAGHYQRLHHKVFLIGPAPPSFAARARAAVLAVGAHAAVSLDAAQALLVLGPEPAGPIHITVSGRQLAQRAGIIIHRSTLVASEVRDIRGIPVTSPARMICDRAARLLTGDLEQLLIDARVARCVTDQELTAVLDRAPGRAGTARVRALLADEAEEGYSRSQAERRLRRLVRESGLPPPVYNQACCGFKPDGRWERQRLIVEVDGRRYHGHATAFERDRRRDQILVAAGYRVIRITWRQLVNEPIAVAVRIAQALTWGEPAA